MLDREVGIWPEIEVVHRPFLHHLGFEVLEVVAEWVTDGRQHWKLFWIRTPTVDREIDGKQNPFFHADFSEVDLPCDYKHVRKLEEACRRKVQRLFDEHWGG